jgi:hypothetical protein
MEEKKIEIRSPQTCRLEMIVQEEMSWPLRDHLHWRGWVWCVQLGETRIRVPMQILTYFLSVELTTAAEPNDYRHQSRLPMFDLHHSEQETCLMDRSSLL